MAAQTRFVRHETGDRIAAADYVATLAADLAAIARQHRMDMLGYLLEMARLEAENEGRHSARRRTLIISC